ncbi:hypothetical protein HQ447_07830 [bacterium]|nr:hypothetical protein [bacterium]
MTTENIHQLAEATTPKEVEIPKTYAGLIVWAIGKWGIGVVFAAFLIPVYQDLKASNQRLADISQANVEVLTALATKIDATNQQVQRMDDSIRRLETRPAP